MEGMDWKNWCCSKVGLLGSAVMCLAIFGATPHAAQAAYLYMDPASQNVSVGETLTLKLNMNTEGEKVQAAEAWIDYNTDEFSLIEVKDPVESEKRFANKLLSKSRGTLMYIANWIAIESDAVATPPDGLAVMTLKALKPGGFSLKMRCTQGDTRDSAITARRNKKTEDLIDCSKVINATINVIAQGQPTPTNGPATATPTRRVTTSPNPTTRSATPSARPTNRSTTTSPTPSSTQTPTPVSTNRPATATPTRVQLTPTGGVGGADASASALPKSGEVSATGIAIGIGIILTIVSIVVKVMM
ncbi:hypothetical protein A3I56_00175 [Candidatus Roizmanbacteria bacterium RIFCSPLOWO2_02_FULL_43_10]|uniref:Cohesin domain-containing protein n=1 Tax=Candidatus Roizmanbacteria bacterium RIFCSPLOWO2_02_FULL_43_10 TaxID=1802078 RepID=A0A1F7JUB4_9BACT|nr:MAG: hypothetical protein A3I56_00175 [Candidatus Roizmanbacteria bacterium RIFCSPLOWO2_02_FULL_43_10]